MAKAILTRVGLALVSLFALFSVVFLLLRLSGDPVYFLVDRDSSPQQVEYARHLMGIDQPLPTQYVLYVGQLLQGDLGISFYSKTPVAGLILARLPNTMLLGGLALLLTITIGVPLGIYAAYYRRGRFDRVVRLVAALGQSVPSFWLGLLLILIFAVGFRVLPSGGFDGPKSLILPAVTLSAAATAGLTRLLRSGMIETLGSDFILFHRMKGLPEGQILWKHALRNAGITALSFVGILTASLFTGSILVETVFYWPGMGRFLYESIAVRDFNVVEGLVLVFATAYIVINLTVDVLYTLLNPRLR